MLLFCAVLGASPGEGSVPRFHLDEELIPLIGQGDGQALTIFYHQTEKALYAYLLSLLRDPEDTQDVMQDTYLKIRSCAHLYQPQGKAHGMDFYPRPKSGADEAETAAQAGRIAPCGRAGKQSAFFRHL